MLFGSSSLRKSINWEGAGFRFFLSMVPRRVPEILRTLTVELSNVSDERPGGEQSPQVKVQEGQNKSASVHDDISA